MKDFKKDKLLNAIELLFKVREINLVKMDEPKEYFGKKLVDPDRTNEYGYRQEILKTNLEEFETHRGKFHSLAIRNLIRWSHDSITPERCLIRVIEGDWGLVTLEMTKTYGETFAV